MNIELQNKVKLELINRLTSNGVDNKSLLPSAINFIIKADLNSYRQVEEINDICEELIFENFKGVQCLDWFNARCISTILNG